MQIYDMIRHGPARRLARAFEQNARAAISSNSELDAVLARYHERSPSTGASYSDYLTLYRWVRNHRPAEVLECGTGVTTVIIAQALKENDDEFGAKGRVTSMEEHQRYFDAACSAFPASLAGYAEIILSPAIEDHYQIFRGVRYAQLPDRPYELVFVDGPDLHVDPTGPDPAFDMDLLSVILKSPRAVAALIDTRTITCFVYSLLFPHTFRYDNLRRLGILAPSTVEELTPARALVRRAMRERALQRPPLSVLLTGRY